MFQNVFNSKKITIPCSEEVIKIGNLVENKYKYGAKVKIDYLKVLKLLHCCNKSK
jgi:hypothetical protein